MRSTLLSTQSRSWARGRAAPRPRSVSSYSTLAGTAAKTVRVTNPYSSSRRNVRVSTLGLTPSSRYWRTLNRAGPASSAPIASADHLAASTSSTSRPGPSQPDAHPERTSNGVDASGNFCPSPGGPFGGGPQCTTTYTEGIYVGYRWYDHQHLTPLYPFGYGLSYSRFGYSGLTWLRDRDGGLDVSFRVTNTGAVTGDEVPQVYLGAPASPPAGVAFAGRALAAYTRITLRPGQSSTISLHVPLRQLQYWDTRSRSWATATGNRSLYVGGDERSAALAAAVTVSGR